jgi:hypothetical protein
MLKRRRKKKIPMTKAKDQNSDPFTEPVRRTPYWLREATEEELSLHRRLVNYLHSKETIYAAEESARRALLRSNKGNQSGTQSPSPETSGFDLRKP